MTPLSISWFISLVEEYRYVTVRTMIVQTISILTIFSFIRESNDYKKYAAIIIVTNILTMFLNLFFAKKYIKFFGYEKYEIKKHIRPVFFIFGSSVAATVYVNSDVTILGILAGDYNVGIYTAAVKIVRIIISFTSAASTVILPRVSYYLKKGMEEQYIRLVKRGLDFLLMIGIPASTGLIFVNQMLVDLVLGNKYRDAGNTLKILAPDVLLSPLSGYISYQIVLPQNKEKVFMISTMISCVVNIVLNFLLIPLFHENAAAFTTLLSETLNILICIFYTKSEIEYKVLFRNIKNYLIGAGIMGGALFLAGIVAPPTYIVLFISIVIGCFIYFLYLILVKDEMALYVRNQIIEKIIRWSQF